MGLEDLNAYAEELQRNNNRQLAQTNLYTAADYSPDDYAAMSMAAKKIGIAPSLLPPSPAERKRLALPNEVPSGKTAAWLGADQGNAILAQDSVTHLSNIEEYLVNPLHQFTSKMRMTANRMALPLAHLSDAITGGDNATYDTEGAYQQALQEYRTSKPASDSGFWGGLLKSAPELAGFAATGPLGLIGMVGGSALTTEEDLLQKGASKDAAEAMGALSGITSTLMTMLPFKGNKALGGWLENRALKWLASSESYPATIARGMGAQTAFGVTTRALEKDLYSQGGYPDLAAEINPFGARELGSDVAFGGVFGAKHVRDSRIEAAATREAEAKLGHDYFSALASAVDDSPLTKRMPEKMREFIAEAKQGGPVQEVFISPHDWYTVWQDAGQDPLTMAEELAGGKHTYQEALAFGHDMTIPIENLLTADPKAKAGLMEVAKLKVGGMHQRDVEAFSADREAKLAEIDKAMGTEQPEGEPQAWRTIYDDIHGQMMGLKSYDRKTAEDNAKLATAHVMALADRLGKDPVQFWHEENNLRLSNRIGEEPPRPQVDVPLFSALDRLRSGDIPQDSAIFGQSLLQFLRERGIADDRGDLKSMDVDKNRKPGERNILRPDGMPLDKVREAAVEAGYLPEGSDITAMLQAVDGEMRGTPAYSSKPADERLFNQQQDLKALQDDLDRKGIDLHQMSNEEIGKRMWQGGETMYQDMLPPGQVPTVERIAEAKRQYDAVNVLKDGQGRLVTEDGKLSALNEHQYRQVRTPMFKAWFGDWEEVNKLRELDNKQPMKLDGTQPLADKKSVEDVFRAFTDVKNIRDGRYVTFPVSMVGKITRHKGFDIKQVAGAFDRLFADALPVLSEVELRKEGHKEHPEISSYHHYVSKFEYSGKPYYIRFTVQQMKGKQGKPGNNLAHSSFVSEVTVYEEKGATPESAGGRVIDPVLTDRAAPVDLKLAQWFKDVKQVANSTSKVVNPETGEPLVVYHGTADNIEAFDPDKTMDGVFWFTSNKAGLDSGDIGAAGHGQAVDTFLSLKKIAGWDEYEKYGIDELASQGYDGVQLDDDFIVFDPNNIKSSSGNVGTFSKDTNNIFYQDATAPRGFFRSAPGSPLREIGILEKADPTTFLHEISHWGVDDLLRYGTGDNAPVQLKADVVTLKDWWAKDAEKVAEWSKGAATADEIRAYASGEGDNEAARRGCLEYTADGGVTYFMEGKSPAPGLTGVFQRLSLWLKNLYQKLSGQGVRLTPEVRDLMNRWYATDAQIEQARTATEQKPLFTTARDAGMSDAQFEAYKHVAETAHEAERTNLLNRTMNEMRREQQTWWKEESGKVKEEVTTEAQEAPVYRALQEVLKGKSFDGTETPGLKINRAELVERYGEEFVKKLPKGSATEYLYAEDGAPADLVAKRYDFSSGDEMFRVMLESPKFKEFVRNETTRRMKERHGDMLLDGSIVDEALAAVHNESWDKLALAEIKALRAREREVKGEVNVAATEARKQAEYEQRWKDAEHKLSLAMEKGAGQAKLDELKAEAKSAKEADRQARKQAAEGVPKLEDFREYAKRSVADKVPADIRPSVYLEAERKAGSEAYGKNLKGDYAGAAQARTRQLANYYLFREATQALKDVKTIETYLKRMATRKAQGKVGKGGEEYLAQIQGILERHGLADPAGEPRRPLADFLADFDEAGAGTMISPEILNELQGPVDYKKLNVTELKSLYDAVRSIEYMARESFKLRLENETINLQDGKNRLSTTVYRNTDQPGKLHLSESSMTRLEKFSKAAKELESNTLRGEFLISLLDGDKWGGDFRKLLWDEALRARDKRNDLKKMVFDDMAELLNNLPKEHAKTMRDMVEIRELKNSFSRDQLIGMALNFGNESNLDKVMRGGIVDYRPEMEEVDFETGNVITGRVRLSPEAINEIKGKLTAADWQLVQGIWKTLERLRPEMSTMVKRMNGIDAVWIDAKPFTVDTADGQTLDLEGGYYPMVYDRRGSKAGEKQAADRPVTDFANDYLKAATQQGHLKERIQGAANPINVDWHSILSRHLSSAITDIAYREFVYNSRRLVESKTVKDAVISRHGQAIYDQLTAWLKSTIGTYYTGDAADGPMMRVMGTMRANASVAILGGRMDAALADTMVSFSQAYQRIDAKYIVRGAQTFLRSPKAAWSKAAELSKQMEHYDQNLDSTLSETLARIQGSHTILDEIRRFSVEVRAFAYKIGAVSNWWGGYYHATEKMQLEPAEAVKYADSLIRTTQDAGTSMDQSNMERNPIVRQFTMFLGPSVINYNNMRMAMRQGAREGSAAKAAGRAALVVGAKVVFNPYVFRTIMGTLITNALIYPLLRGKGPKEDDEWGTWATAHMLTEPFAGIPFANEAARFLESKMTGEPYQARNTPPAELLKALTEAGTDWYKVHQGDKEPIDAMKHSWNALGMVSGMPSGSSSIVLEYLYDVFTGNYDPAHAWSPATDIFWRRKKH